MQAPLVILVTFGIGFVSGLRALTPLALVCWVAVWGWMPLTGSRLAFLGTTTGAVIVTVLALAELIGDKLPQTPGRTQAVPLFARIVTGALSAVAICFTSGQSWWAGVIFGALGSIAGTFAGYHARRALTRRWPIPDLVVALAEDFLTVTGTLLVFAALFLKW
jgi:uncharacterized membrane protein